MQRRHAALAAAGALLAPLLVAPALSNPASAATTTLRGKGATITRTVTTTAAGSNLVIRARGAVCSGNPRVRVTVDAQRLTTVTVTSSRTLRTLNIKAALKPGRHRVQLKVVSSTRRPTCGRRVVVRSLAAVPLTSSTPTPSPAAPSVVSKRPTAANTGVPAGTTLTKVGIGGWVQSTDGRRYQLNSDGKILIYDSNVTISGYDIAGVVDVRGNNVTVTNCYIRGMDLGPITTEANSRGNMSLYFSAGSGNIISRSTLRPDAYWNYNGTRWVDARWIGLGGGGFTADAVDNSGSIDLAQTIGNNVSIVNSYFHDSTQYPAGKDPWLQVLTGGAWKNDPSHSDGWQIQGGSNLRLEGSSIDWGKWSAMQFTQDVSKTDNVVISGNWLSGGKCTINFADNPKRGAFTGVQITNNVFGGVNPDPKYGISGCNIFAIASTQPRIVATGNTTTNGVAANTVLTS